MLMQTPQERYAQICKEYADGAERYDLEQKYQLSRQMIYRILKEGGVPLRPYNPPPVNRDTFLGANIGSETKEGLRKLAIRKGESVSALTDRALQDMIDKEAE